MEMTSEGVPGPDNPMDFPEQSHAHSLFQLRTLARTSASPNSVPASLPFTRVHTHTNCGLHFIASHTRDHT